MFTFADKQNLCKIVKTLDEYELVLTFENGEIRLFDMA
ncbi:hypothetical protein B0P06_005856 [Clostridium saccharoperbutylacetonicum]|nr:hypothetical protein [Clostridium saccharoperbutylacetonicum]